MVLLGGHGGGRAAPPAQAQHSRGLRRSARPPEVVRYRYERLFLPRVERGPLRRSVVGNFFRSRTGGLSIGYMETSSVLRGGQPRTSRPSSETVGSITRRVKESRP